VAYKCGVRSSYSCGAAEDFPPRRDTTILGFWIADFGFNLKSKI
jgi:hypothetical protein